MAQRRSIPEGTEGRETARRTRRLRDLLRRETVLWKEGFCRIAGVDEAGVGPLAGPLAAAAVVFPPGFGLPGVDDSKRLSEARREQLADAIRSSAAAFAVALVEPAEIDRMNVYRAGLEAMRRAVASLPEPPDFVLVDGRRIPGIEIPQESLIGGDSRCHAIAAASILAKTQRDDAMRQYDLRYPGYGFAHHKGYPTSAHRDAIRRLGPCAIHRRSFTLLRQQDLWGWTSRSPRREA